jgi:hypothetical protein
MVAQNKLTEQDTLTTKRLRGPIIGLIFGYMLLVRLLPYIFHKFGMQLDPNISYYPWNFSPAFAVCLFGGAVFHDRRMAIVLPLSTFLLSDLGVWALTGRFDWAFYPWQFAVYLCIAFCAALGFLLKNNRSVLKFAGAGFAGCTVFFVVTNFAVWWLSGTYPRTWEGLLACYVAAIPYYRNSLLGTTFFASVLFSPVCLREVTGESASSSTRFAVQYPVEKR